MAPEDRREAILDAALELFKQRGWDAVTIADVLAAAEISKGGFYHHFAAKEDLLTGLVTRMTAQALEATEAARVPATGNALDRLNAFLTETQRWTADNIEDLRGFTEIFAQPSNNVLYRRIGDAEAAAVMPMLTQMIADGVSEGVFDAADPPLVAEIMLCLSQGRQAMLADALGHAAAGDLDGGANALDRRMRAEGAALDRLLGLPEGSVRLSNPQEFKRMLAGLTQNAV